MPITLQLDDEQSNRLEDKARQLGVDPRVLAKVAISELLARPSDEFQQAAEKVMQKNSELYRRLS